ncbi:3-phosphoshikimate 1-carboxyvinyltransferase [bacterium]|nr:3-phosphoshikimate 1-carboxyvinyltransferase [bacterium]
MARIVIKKTKTVRGEINVLGDKSISHRAVILGSISSGMMKIKGFLNALDCQATIKIFSSLGVKIENLHSDELLVHGKGLKNLNSPLGMLNVGNSGTTIRLVSGILSGQDFSCSITGDESIKKRPMKRIIHPLREMGAEINAFKDNYPPLNIVGKTLHSINYNLPIASAQVKSCILLAGLLASGETSVSEPFKSRDHTERMLGFLGADIKISGRRVTISGKKELKSKNIIIPGDISSASFFIVAATLLENSQLIIKNIGLNSTRTGIINILRAMGADIEEQNKAEVCNEPVGDLWIKGSLLRGIEIRKEDIPGLIDEIPILAVAATQAKGITEIKGAEELRVKESDRIKVMSLELSKMGAKIEEKKDGMLIYGPTKLKGCPVDSFGDHRVAMALSVAGLVASGRTVINNTDCINTSFPGFEEILKSLI